MNWDLLLNEDFLKVVETAVFIGIALLLRHLAIRAILHNAPKGEVRRRWIVSVRNLTFVVLLFVVLAIWSGAIVPYATALLAVAVASVIATKEIIHCLLGSVLRTVGNTYSIGDRIEIGLHRGDVIDITALTTTLLEVGPGKASHLRTGRTIVLPNSKLTDTYVINESNMQHYVVHYFSVPVPARTDWKDSEQILLAAAETQCASYIESARDHMAELERKHGLEGLPLRPRVFVEIPDSDKINLVVRIPTPVGAQGRLEQAVLRRYLDQSLSMREEARGMASANPE